MPISGARTCVRACERARLTASDAGPIDTQSEHRSPGVVSCAEMLRKPEASGAICLTRQLGMGRKFDRPYAMGSYIGITNRQSNPFPSQST